MRLRYARDCAASIVPRYGREAWTDDHPKAVPSPLREYHAWHTRCRDTPHLCRYPWQCANPRSLSAKAQSPNDTSRARQGCHQTPPWSHGKTIPNDGYVRPCAPPEGSPACHCPHNACGSYPCRLHPKSEADNNRYSQPATRGTNGGTWPKNSRAKNPRSWTTS